MDHHRCDHAPLEDYSEDELLCELRARESRSKPERRPLYESPLLRLERVDDAPPRARTMLRDVSSRRLFDALRRSQVVRYGSDDRRDLRDVTLSPVLRNATAVVALFHRSRVSDSGDGTSRLETTKLGLRFGLGPSEPFVDQPSGAYGTGFLVAPRVIATAGHCVEPPSVAEIRIVFGFQMIDETSACLVVPNEDVYTGARVIGRQDDRTGPDWALIELDRPVTGRTPLRIRRAGKLADGERLYVLGHPSGLPLKFADNAVVRDNGKAAFFVANLDTCAGSSGSPVFNAAHEVEGIVSRGERDFILVDGGYASLVCPDNGGRGQDCIRTTEFSDLTPV